MSDVNALLEKLCPEGVEYKQIKDFARSIFRGAGIKREQLCDKGIPCVRYGEIYTTYGLWFEKCVSHTSLDVISSPKWVENGDILFAVTGESVDEISKATAYVGEEKCLAGGDIVVLKHTQNAKYLSYVLDSEMLKKQKRSGKVKSKVVHASISSIEQLVVPIPPLEIQEAIVNVLDRYSDAKEKLIHELALELDARKKQYEHYRDQILSFEIPVETYELKDIADFRTGNKPELIIDNPFEGGYKYINAGTTCSGYVRESNCDGDVVTTPSRGQGGIGFVGYQKDSFWLGPLCYRIVSKNSSVLKNKYLFYWLTNQTENILKRKKEGGVPALNAADLGTIRVLVPPIKVQERIINVLDNFEIVCADLNVGLPAEIDARQKQYEYYRDKLLTFKEKK